MQEKNEVKEMHYEDKLVLIDEYYALFYVFPCKITIRDEPFEKHSYEV